MLGSTFRSCCLALALLASGPAGAPAEGTGDNAATLRHAGQAIEIRGLRTRVIAFYEGSGEQIALTVLVSGGALGAEVLRAGLRLRDGQSHAVMMDGGDGSGGYERYSFTRAGHEVRVTFSPVAADGPIRVGSVDPSDAGDAMADLVQ